MASSEYSIEDDHVFLPPPFEPHEPFGPQQSDQQYSYGLQDPLRRDTYATVGSTQTWQDEEPGYGQRNYDPYNTDSESGTHELSQMEPPASTRTRARDPYPAWSTERQIPLSREEIEDIFVDLTQRLGFQRDSMRNMLDFTMQLLDSRASRMPPNQALLTLHADYIGGQNANYRKWYFAAQLNLDDTLGQIQNPGLRRLGPTRSNKNIKMGSSVHNDSTERWKQAMDEMSDYERMRQIALYLLCWGEAAQVRFIPECLCFIFKCADDYYRSSECQNRVQPVKEGLYLQNVIKPLYRFVRDQGYEIINGKFARKEKDHSEIIGYDDLNQTFWYPEGIARIVLNDNTRLVDIPPAQRFMKFDRIQWGRVFSKTYYERRSLGQWLVNFNRIWVIHIAIYWFYTAYNSPSVFNGARSTPMRWSTTALGGAVATLIMIAATFAEFSHLPTSWSNISYLTRRLLCLLVILAFTAGPTFYIAKTESRTPNQRIPLILGIVQFTVSVAATLIFSVTPSGLMFGGRVVGRLRKSPAGQTFTASYPSMTTKQRLSSVFLWFLVFGCKFAGSYFFLTLSFRQSINAMVGLKVKACTDKYFGDALCANQVIFTLTIMYIVDLVLFFLDTFLWWIIWNAIFSIVRSFYLGVSTWTSWRAMHSKLPTRIYSQILATSYLDIEHKPEILVSQIWNAVITSMYRDHLLSIDHVQKLLYTRIVTKDGQPRWRAPHFLNPQSENWIKGSPEPFPSDGEAERRISYFSRSLATPIPASIPIDAMPTFTVLTPHYSEKILLSLREVIREEDQTSRITLLEYLKQLHPVEWDNFVLESKTLAQEAGSDNRFPIPVNSTDDLPLNSVGFRSSAPEFTLRTRFWSSLRAQTLYRTVSGMMNYAQAIKLLYRVENPQVVQPFQGNTETLERELEWMARRKFKFVVSMQRFVKFNREELENVELLLRAYPDLQIAYLEEEPAKKEGGDPRLFSALIDGYSKYDVQTGKRLPKYRIGLPGSPILGDGKSDNQNHAIIFYRGEYLQLVDANQDNYLEECLKIRNVLGEFEEYEVASQSPYAHSGQNVSRKSPVAIVGGREYTFSEGVGVLGDLNAGKQQTFGTLTARTLSWLGGKLHYGHSDFLNGLYMTTRGGVSKAQKGLHLNEDAYAGMNAFGRGGRIKHVEYFRCGKGRDLGFGTILNFMTKMATGMSEQMLSREYYYLGTQLPLDRFLTFYYAHPGFQINNVLMILSTQVLVVAMVFMGTLNSSLACKPNTNDQLLNRVDNCHFLIPAKGWITRCIITVFLVFMIGFIPPFLQELMDRGARMALLRLGKQILSFSPAFEVSAIRISSNAVTTNLVFGGARYIATGRGFATSRTPFGLLFSRFAGPSIYFGVRVLIMLLYVTITLWTPWIVYLWVWTLALCISPFLFNPHQFVFVDFFIDYREFLRWMSRGNSNHHYNSWIGYRRLSRTMITGLKKITSRDSSARFLGDIPRATWRAVLFPEVIWPVLTAVIFMIAYMFVKAFPDRNGNRPPNGPLVRIVVISVGPLVWNAGVLAIQFLISLLLGHLFYPSFPRSGSTVALIAHALGLIGTVGFFEFFWFLELWDASHAALGLVVIISIQRAICKTVWVLLTREFAHDQVNRAWWTGKWYGRDPGVYAVSQAAREFIIKVIELSLWSSDFLIGHALLFVLAPPILIPYFDKLHITLLFWLRPSNQIRAPIFTIRQQRQRRWIVKKYGIVFVLAAGVFVVLLAVPLTLPKATNFDCSLCRML